MCGLNIDFCIYLRNTCAFLLVACTAAVKLNQLVLFFTPQFVRVAKQVLGSSLSDAHAVVRLPLTLLAFVLKNIVLMYPVTVFMLLSWEHCFKVRFSPV